MHATSVPAWVSEILKGWIDTDNPRRTQHMENAVDWREIRGSHHARNVAAEVATCIADNVLPDQKIPLYAAYGWLRLIADILK